MLEILVTLTKEDLCKLFKRGDELEFTGNQSMYAPRKPDGSSADCYAITDSDRAVFKVVNGLIVRVRNRLHPEDCIGIQFMIEESDIARHAVHMSIIDITDTLQVFGEMDRTWEEYTFAFDEEYENIWSSLRGRSIINTSGFPLPAQGNA